MVVASIAWIINDTALHEISQDELGRRGMTGQKMEMDPLVRLGMYGRKDGGDKPCKLPERARISVVNSSCLTRF